MKTYSNLDQWKKIQYFFPEHTRINRGNYPKEEIWKRKNMDVHLDRYIPKESPKDIKIILVHGGGGNGRLMSPIAVPLVRLGYECIAPDLPGFGLTTYKKTIEYQDWINLLVDLIDKESKKDNKSVVLIGTSLGGMLAYQVACYISNIKGLIVTALIDSTEPKNQGLISRSESFAHIGNQFLNNFPGILDNLKIPIKEITKMDKMANNEDFVYLMKKDRVGSGSWVHLKWVRTLQNTGVAIEPEFFEKCPLLFLHPKKDNLVNFEVSKNFYDRLGCMKDLVYLENCGHIPLEEPGVSTMEKAIKGFLMNLK